MTQKDNGGPAFPHESYDPETDMDVVQTGMTLRDWFAGQALANARTFPKDWSATCDIAEWAYEIADAMLAERSE